jgi:predicted GH43/DUF377 family glycosyl hydrolase
MESEIFVRERRNPILTAGDLPFKATAVFNPGVVEIDGEVLLLLRIVDRRGISEIRVARSRNGVDDWRIDDHPLLEPDLPENPFEEWGCEDARVSKVGENEWVISYTAYSRYGPAVAVATTSDFDTATRLGVVLSPTNKDATVFPQKFDGSWMMLHRPVTGGAEHIWYAFSPNGFTNWSQPGVLIPQRGGPWWDSLRVGVGAPPIRTNVGWLLIYHGVTEMGLNLVYRLGLCMLDLNDPRKVLRRSSYWVFGPETDYESHGYLPNVVFTCGAIPRGDEVWMYYGAADTSLCLAVAKLNDLVTFVCTYDFMVNVGHEKGMIR